MDNRIRLFNMFEFLNGLLGKDVYYSGDITKNNNLNYEFKFVSPEEPLDLKVYVSKKDIASQEYYEEIWKKKILLLEVFFVKLIQTFQPTADCKVEETKEDGYDYHRIMQVCTDAGVYVKVDFIIDNADYSSRCACTCIYQNYKKENSISINIV